MPQGAPRVPPHERVAKEDTGENQGKRRAFDGEGGTGRGVAQGESASPATGILISQASKKSQQRDEHCRGQEGVEEANPSEAEREQRRSPQPTPPTRRPRGRPPLHLAGEESESEQERQGAHEAGGHRSQAKHLVERAVSQ